MSSRMSPSEIVLRFFEGTRYLVPGKSYHSALPEDLREWYCYTIDGGHSILSLIEGSFDEGAEDLLDDLCPCPVKAVLRKYRIFNGYPVVPLQYNSEIGLITEPDDDEY